jgi:hypothetical protein
VLVGAGKGGAMVLEEMGFEEEYCLIGQVIKTFKLIKKFLKFE